ncbi:TIGR00341 family protein [Thermodesulfobacteriota bacterium]
MGLRIIEFTLDRDVAPFVDEAVKDCPLVGMWKHELCGRLILIRILVLSEEVEDITDILEKNYGTLEEFRAVVMEAEATLPRIQAVDRIITDPEGRVFDVESGKALKRISREELYVSVVDSASVSGSFLALAILSALVAAIGLLRDNVAIIIGSMVIAPLLGPNIALAFGATIGDTPLVKRSLKACVLGIGSIFIVSVALGSVLATSEWVEGPGGHVSIGPADVGLALAAGIAGALSFTSGLSAALVGVMVAVALVPPLVHTGLLLGGDYLELAKVTSLIFATNIICINLSAIVTFLIQRIGPGYLDPTGKARTSTIVTLIFWILFLFGVIAIILARQDGGYFSQWDIPTQ